MKRELRLIECCYFEVASPLWFYQCTKICRKSIWSNQESASSKLGLDTCNSV